MLPADRAEFNDDDSTVELPSHVQFVPLSDKQLWSLWEDWVMQVWFNYCERMVQTVNEAQRGNPYFGGAFSFQLAGWYAIRDRSKLPVSYQWRDFNRTLHREQNEILSEWKHCESVYACYSQKCLPCPLLSHHHDSRYCHCCC